MKMNMNNKCKGKYLLYTYHKVTSKMTFHGFFIVLKELNSLKRNLILAR